jgi:hypothetical protein
MIKIVMINETSPLHFNEQKLEYESIVLAPSTPSLLCIQQVNPDRISRNVWVSWKTEEGRFIDEARKGYLLQQRKNKNDSRQR